MISETLLKEVIKKEISITNFIDSSRKIYNIGSDVIIPTTYGSHDYNIYELAHKCKEWAETHNFNLVSSTSFQGDAQPCCMPVHSSGCEHNWVDANTEPEAIFKACEWIMEQ